MAKGPIVSEKVQEMIAEVCAAQRNWSAKKVQSEVASRLANDPYRGPGHLPVPGLSYVQKKLQEVKLNLASRPPEVGELDQPFTLAALDKHPIPPESLPAVLKVWEYEGGREPPGNPEWVKRALECGPAEDMPRMRRYGPGQPMTIRMATWAARLSFVVQGNHYLAHYARAYATRQLITDALDSHFDTSDLDRALLLHLAGIAGREEEPNLWYLADSYPDVLHTEEEKQEWVKSQVQRVKEDRRILLPGGRERLLREFATEAASVLRAMADESQKFHTEEEKKEWVKSQVQRLLKPESQAGETQEEDNEGTHGQEGQE